MALQFDNRTIRRKTPVRRNNKFFSAEDFNLQMEWSKECVEQQMVQTVILYQVDYNRTKIDDTYIEARKDNIRFKEPVELPCVYEIQDSEMKSYEKTNQHGVYSKPGKLTFSVLIPTLEEYGCDINRGDYVGIQIDTQHIEYFTVTDDGRTNALSNKFTLFGTVPFARTIQCAPISDISEFNG